MYEAFYYKVFKNGEAERRINLDEFSPRVRGFKDITDRLDKEGVLHWDGNRTVFELTEDNIGKWIMFKQRFYAERHQRWDEFGGAERIAGCLAAEFRMYNTALAQYQDGHVIVSHGVRFYDGELPNQKLPRQTADREMARLSYHRLDISNAPAKKTKARGIDPRSILEAESYDELRRLLKV